jgi:branched-chain amino acid transport system substrate-binding protein
MQAGRKATSMRSTRVGEQGDTAGARRRRRRVLPLAIGALALVVAGCGSSDSSSGGGGSADAGSGGCKGLKVGVISEMTGTFSTYGETAMNAAKLAVEDLKKSNPDCEVELVPFDTQGDPKQAPGVARKAIGDKAMVAVLGPTFSGVSEAAVPIFNDAGMPVVTGVSTNGKLSAQGWKVFHRTVVNDEQEGPAEARYMVQKLGYKAVAVIDNGQSYGKGLGELVRAELKKEGAPSVDDESLNATGNDYSSTINRIRASKADAVFCACLDPEAARLAKQLRAAGDKTPFLGGAGVHTAQFLKQSGPGAEGAMVGSGGIDANKTPEGKAWLKRWEDTYGGPPDLYGLEWFNAATAVMDAIGAGKTDRQSLNEHISTSTFDTPAGPVSFDERGDVKNATINWYTVKGGKFVITDSVPLQ